MQPQTPDPALNGSTPGTVNAAADSVIQGALGNSTARPNLPLAQQSDALYEAVTKKEGQINEPAKPTEEAPSETPPAETTEAPREETPPAETEPTGHYADEGIEDEPEAKLPTNQSIQQPIETPQQLDAYQQFLAQRIGPPINVQIKDESSPTGVRTVQAYAPENLPEGFEYANDSARTQALTGFARLTNEEAQIRQQYQYEQNQQTAEALQTQEDRSIQRDIAYLQREKAAGRDGLDLLPDGLTPNTPEFNDHPAVQEMQEILNYYNEENETRREQNQELIQRAIRNGQDPQKVRLTPLLTYRDAFKIYRSENPKASPKQQAEDNQRKEISKPLANASKTRGDDNTRTQTPKLGRMLNYNLADIADIAARAYNLEG